MFTMSFDVEKTTIIKCSIADVFKSVADFSTWPKWSPWLCQEPTCPVTIEGTSGTVGHSQAWDGSFIGSGKIHITATVANDHIDYELKFFKPWKGSSKAGFRFASVGEGTEVTWWMRGTLPVWVFFMKNMMSAMIGSDYSRGLSMLKEFLETKTVLSETTLKGLVDRPFRFYLGMRRSCALSDVGPAMEEDFIEMGRLLESSKLPNPQQIFSIYHSYDMVKGRCEYTSGFLYDSPQKAPEGVAAGEIPAHKAVEMDHRGPYRHLGNAWSAAMNYTRSKHKVNKRLPMYEIYPNNPNEVAEKDVQVEIYIPVSK